MRDHDEFGSENAIGVGFGLFLFRIPLDRKAGAGLGQSSGSGTAGPHSRRHSSVPWFDEYNFKLGRALTAPPTAAWSQGVWRRDFMNGISLVNPTSAAVTVTVEPGFQRLSGTQDSVVNNGSAVSVTARG